MNIEWKDGAVCYAKGRQWLSHTNTHLHDGGCHIISIKEALESTDFQLNIPREGDYLRKEDLDSEGKYNHAVEVFGLFGWELFGSYKSFILIGDDNTRIHDCLRLRLGSYEDHICVASKYEYCKDDLKRELTYNQLMTIGTIKRLLDGQESAKVNDTVCGQPKEDFIKAIERVNELESEGDNYRAEQAYDILQSLDYEYDLVEQRWYRKDWV